MKKKHRFFFKRFAALVAASFVCASLCVPCFASNNASSQKWVIVDEAQMLNEMGTRSKYFRISPYSGGQLYRTNVITQVSSVENNYTGSVYYDWWAVPLNYPDLWRAPVPLGSKAYLQIDNPKMNTWNRDTSSGSTYGETLPAPVSFILVDPSFGFNISRSYTSSAMAISQDVFAYPVSVNQSVPLVSGGSTVSRSDAFGLVFNSFPSSSVGSMPIENFTQIVLGVPDTSGTYLNFTLSPVRTHYSASSDSLFIMVYIPDWCTYNSPGTYYLSVSAIFSYWVDANKLPAGLQVGDEFPADTDAFDKLRDDLIKQFPEASENIENGKATIEGWNNTETVDTDVALTSISALNALFQNLGGFLFIVSLMVFGAVVLRMLIRKAVDG